MDIHDTLIAKGAHWEDDERYSNTLRLPSDFIFVVANLELLNPSFSGVTTGISSPTSVNTDVGELFTSLGFFPFMQRDIIQGEMSPDDIRTSGMYDVGNSTTMPFNYGGLLVFNTKTLTIQTGVDLQGKTICIRVSWNNGPWSSWNNFTFNQQSI